MLTRNQLSGLDAGALRILAGEKSRQVTEKNKEIGRVDADIKNKRVTGADGVLLSAGTIGVIAGVGAAVTGGLGAMVIGGGLLLGGMLGVIGGADQVHDKLRDAEDLRARRKELVDELRVLDAESALIEDVYNGKFP